MARTKKLPREWQPRKFYVKTTNDASQSNCKLAMVMMIVLGSCMMMKPLKSLMRRHVTIIVITVKYCSSYTLKKNIITMNLGDISKDHFSVIM
jgi:hypothetical protein